MYRFMLLAVGVVAYVAHAQAGDSFAACGRLGHRGFKCCKREITPKLPTDDLKECFQMPRKPQPSCEIDICIAKKKGVASDDGTIDAKTMAESVDMMFENDPDIAENIKDNCLGDSLSKYGPADFCDLVKHKMCVEVQVMKSCNDWSEDGDCKGMKELAEECLKQFP